MSDGMTRAEDRAPGVASAELLSDSAMSDSSSDGGSPTASKPYEPSTGLTVSFVGAVVVNVVLLVLLAVLFLKTDLNRSASTAEPPNPAVETSVAAPQTAVDEAPPVENQGVGVGQPVRDGNFEFVVTGVERAPALGDPLYPEAQTFALQGEYVLVKFTVTNTSAEPRIFYDSDSFLVDGVTRYQPNDRGWNALGIPLADLEPGASIDSVMVFDVPVGTDPKSIELHGGPFSEGVTVGL